MLDRRPLSTLVLCASAMLSAVIPAAAVTRTRSEDQYLAFDPPLPAASHFGATLAVGGPCPLLTWDAVLLTGAPGPGTMAGYRHEPGLGWVQGWFHEGLALEACTVDFEGTSGVYTRRQADGSTSIRSIGCSFGSSDVIVGLGSDVAAVARDGDIIALGQPTANASAGRILIYEDDGNGNWVPQGLFGGTPGERLGSALDLDGGGVLVAGAPGYGAHGAVRVYVRGAEWLDWQRIDSPAVGAQNGRAEFGYSVALDDQFLAIGSPYVDRPIIGGGDVVDVGAVYIYEVPFIFWELTALLRPAAATDFHRFGTGLDLHGVVVVAGSPGEDGAGGGEGAAYVFQHNGAQWQEKVRLVNSAADPNDAFGSRVAVGGVGALVGAPFADPGGINDGGAVLYYRGILTLFDDGFESGDTSAWSSTTP